jgi:type IV secretory pathway VirB10-like protein
VAAPRWRSCVLQSYTGVMNLRRVLLLGLAICLPAVCSAQWRWVDKNGRTVFSDQPPPPDIPAANVMGQPKGSSPANAVARPALAASAAAPVQPPKLPESAGRLAGKDKDLQDKKKQLEAAEEEKRKAQEEEIARLRADNCARAKRAKAGFDSGARIARTNDKGEREYLDDAQRAAEAKRLEGVIAKDCKPAGS